MLGASIVAGNMLEWYEFGLYGYMASILAKIFFPTHHVWLALLLVFSTYAVSFSFRPLGGLVLGYWGDRKGRKFALLVSISAITLVTLAMGLLPTYQTIGILAPVLLIILRLFQGVV